MKLLIAVAAVFFLAQNAVPVYKTVSNVFELKSVIATHTKALDQ